MYVLSAAGADEDIPDTMVLLSTGTCWPLWGETIFTEGVVSDDDDLANEAPVLHPELNKSGYYCEENYQRGARSD